MAITQISKIQVRRGLQEELGQLASGELAWAIDTQRLYIGNGFLSEGAPVGGLTQIYPPTVGGSLSDLGNYVYTGLTQTGYTADTNYTERLVQAKFDDIINVHDFGVRGTGNGDDSAALQKCIDEVYNRNTGGITPYRTRRAIQLPGGVYNISQPLRIPPYASIIGDGLHSPIVNYTGSATDECVIKVVTNLGLDPSDNSSTVSYEYPKSVYISGVTFISAVNIDILVIDSAAQCKFERVNFVGPINTPNPSTSRHSCVVVSSLAAKTTDIVFRDCAFSKLSIAATVSAVEGTENILFDGCSFTNLLQGIVPASNNKKPNGVKIIGSRFETIYDSAISGGIDVGGIVSIGNNYIDVGNGTAQDGPDAALVPVIIFRGSGNYSVADIFGRSLTEDARVPRIQGNNYSFISIGDELTVGNAHNYPGKKYTITNGTKRSFLLPVTNGIINYSVGRSDILRSGIIKFSLDSYNNKVVFDEEYTESSNIGITISMTNTLYGVNLSATASNMGYDATFTFDVKSLF